MGAVRESPLLEVQPADFHETSSLTDLFCPSKPFECPQRIPPAGEDWVFPASWPDWGCSFSSGG